MLSFTLLNGLGAVNRPSRRRRADLKAAFGEIDGKNVDFGHLLLLL